MTSEVRHEDPPSRTQVWAVWGVLVATVALAIACAALPAGPPPSVSAAAQGGSDVEMYGAVRARLAEGAPYYPTLRDALSSRHFALLPVFNWRFPVHLELLAHLPWPGGAQGLYRLLALIAGASMLRGSNRARAGLTAFLVLLQLWAFASPSTLLLSEVWAAALLTLSAAGLLWDKPTLRVLAGVGALCFRELAAPWCVGLTLWALWTGRRREAAAWIGLGAVYLGAWGIHARTVLELVPADALRKSWLGVGGLAQVLSTLKWYVPVRLAPGLAPWTVGAVGLAIVAPPRDAPVVRVVAVLVAAYLFLFTVAGNANNDYWGALIAGLLHVVVFGGLSGAAGVLWRSMRARPEAPAAL